MSRACATAHGTEAGRPETRHRRRRATARRATAAVSVQGRLERSRASAAV